MNQGKRTIVEKSIIHSTPSGRILSATKMRTVYYGSTLGKSVSLHRESSSSWGPLSDVDSIKSGYTNFHDRIPTTSRAKVKHKNRTSSSCSRGRKTLEDLISTQTEYVDLPQQNDTVLYGDEWSTEGTQVRESKLIRSESAWTPSDITHSENSNLKHFANRINYKREQYHCQPLDYDPQLAETARYWAANLVINNEFRCRPGAQMNVWMGSKPRASVIDIWDEEMQEWSIHYFKDARITKVGIARAYDDRRHVFIIVAEYQ